MFFSEIGLTMVDFAIICTVLLIQLLAFWAVTK